MKNSRLAMIAAATLLSAALPASLAHGAGTLAITSVVKTPATMSTPATFTVTGTCVLGAVPVKIKLVNSVSGAVFTPWSSAGCGAGASGTGKSITLAASVVPAGTYKVALKQGSGLAWWNTGGTPQTIILP